MPPVSTSVVVVAYRTHEWLLPSLASVADQCDQLVVVDNGSPDGSVGALVADLATVVVRVPRNLGFAGGANAGLARATSDVVAVLNDDAFAAPGWIESAAALLADEAYAAVGPKVVVDRRYGRVMLSDEPHRVPSDPRRFGRMIRSAVAGAVDVFDRLVGSGIYPVEHGLLDGTPATWRWTAGGSS
jgi:N-acetylglucosaminyl-diphospho-decaprenol L-rhamnosyltransferase